MIKSWLAFGLMMVSASAFAGGTQTTNLSATDVENVLKELNYASQSLGQLKMVWDEVSSDLRRPEPVQTSTQRAERLESISKSYWVDSDNSLRRLSSLLRPRTNFPIGTRVKRIANLEDVRRILQTVVGDDERARENSFIVRFKAALEENSGGLIVGSSGTYGTERATWEARYLDPVDSYLYHLIDNLSRIQLAAATWADIRAEQLLATNLTDRIEAGLYRSFEASTFCKFEIRKSAPIGSGASWLYVRSVNDSESTKCPVPTSDWRIFDCDSGGNGHCRGYPYVGQDQLCRIYSPGIDQAEFDLYCVNWERSWRFRKM